MRSLAKQESGFALVVTLSLMVLLAILCVGMLSLASVEMRSSGASKHDAIARQNALLALQLAIGELQEHLGPDKRTSANAELLAEGSPNPHWVGAWNTEGGFRSWLVSGNENTPLQTDPATDASAPPFSPYNALASSLPTDPGVVLVGEHTAGADTANHVAVPKVLLQEPGDAHPTGRYAWWVGDEGQKANMAAEVRKLPENNMADRLKFLASSPNRGFPTLGGDWKTWLPDGSDAVLAGTGGKFPTRRQIPLANSELVDDEKERFHDFTVSSAGVLSDSKNGGLRKDLSIAFEIPEASFKNSEFARVLTAGEMDPDVAYATNHSGRMASGPMSGRFTKTAVNYRDKDAWSSGFYFRGPTFDQLRDHYQLYRRVSNPFSANASIQAQTFLPNATVTTGGNIRGRGPFGDYTFYPESKYFNAGDSIAASNYEVTDTYGSKPRIRPMATELLPELVRYTYTLAIQSFPDPDPAYPGQYQLRLITTPFMILHNPYNVELKSQALWYRIQRSELQARFEYIDPATNKNVSTQGNAGITLQFLVEQKYGGVTNIEGSEGAYDAIDFFASDNGQASGTISMKPGEFKIFTSRGSAPTEGGELFAPGKNRSIFLQTNLNDLFSTGIYMNVVRMVGWHGSAPFRIPAGTKFKTSIIAKPAWGGSSSANFPHLAWAANEYHTILSKVVSPGVNEPVPTGESQKWDQIRMLSCMQDQWWTGKPTGSISTQLTPEDVQAAPDGPRRYIGRIDMYQKPLYDGTARDNNISLSTHNPRGMVQTMSMTGAQGPASVRGTTTWTGSVVALDPATSSSPGFDNRFWGTGCTIADGGQQNLMLYDIPRAPILSLASLQHANVSRQGVSSAFAIGNSHASPYVPSDKAWWRSSTVPGYPNNTNFWIMDNSYLFNQDLFDSYYFSGVNPGSSSTGWNNPLSAPSVTLGSGDPTSISSIQGSIDKWKEGTGDLLNPRMKFLIPAGLSSADVSKDLDLANSYSSSQTKLSNRDDLRPHNAIAAYTLNQGAFNINSVSVDAWCAQLAGLRGAAVDHFNSSTSLATDSAGPETPFPGSSMPGAGSSTGSDSELWNGFRSLSDPEIEDLAREIVVEIKSRSRDRSGTGPRPFTTMGEFVNRRLASPSDPFSKEGALQAALDRSANKNPSSLSSQMVRAADKNHISVRSGLSETNTVPYANPEALATQTIAGTPQWLTQADLLERIGSQLSARSDTFTVRAYGESVNPDNGQVLSRAWLEATVQRTPCLVNPNDHPALPVVSSSLSNESKTYGRRFTVTAIRWLRPEEI